MLGVKSVVEVERIRCGRVPACRALPAQGGLARTTSGVVRRCARWAKRGARRIEDALVARAFGAKPKR